MRLISEGPAGSPVGFTMPQIPHILSQLVKNFYQFLTFIFPADELSSSHHVALPLLESQGVAEKIIDLLSGFFGGA
jgi:hypothetical protein